MSSSISSSRGELRVLATVAVVLAICEIGVRLAANNVSEDEAHLRNIPTISRTLKESPSPSVLFLGNSLTTFGVDTDSFCAQLKTHGLSPIVARKVGPDGTGLCEWYFLFKNFFVDTDRCPDVTIIGFHASELADSNRVRLRKLARNACTIRDIPELFQFYVTRFADRCDFLLALASSSVGKQKNVKHWILNRFIPNYETVTQRLNATVSNGTTKNGSGSPAANEQTYQQLHRFCAMLQRTNTTGVFVAMPHAFARHFDSTLPQTIREYGMVFIDGREVEGLGTERFFDGLHMDKEGAQLYSRFVADRVAEVLGPELIASHRQKCESIGLKQSARAKAQGQ